MIKRFCDRCGEEIDGDVYHLEFQSESLLRVGFCTSASTSELCNSYAIDPVTKPKRMYCRGCRADILEYAKTPVMHNTNHAGDELQIITEEENLSQEYRELSKAANEFCEELREELREAIKKIMSQLEEKGVFDNIKNLKIFRIHH